MWLRVENSEQILQDRSCVRVWHMLWMRMTTRPAASDLDIHACSKSMADSREAAETWNESCLPLYFLVCVQLQQLGEIPRELYVRENYNNDRDARWSL